MKKRFFSMLLTLCMVVLLLPSVALADTYGVEQVQAMINALPTPESLELLWQNEAEVEAAYASAQKAAAALNALQPAEKAQITDADKPNELLTWYGNLAKIIFQVECTAHALQDWGIFQLNDNGAKSNLNFDENGKITCYRSPGTHFDGVKYSVITEGYKKVEDVRLSPVTVAAGETKTINLNIEVGSPSNLELNVTNIGATPDQVKLSVTGPNYKNEVTLNAANEWKTLLKEIPTGTYTVHVVEGSATVEEYDLTVSGDGTITTEETVILQDGTETKTTQTITNTYKHVAHVGGTATCQAQAVCTTCNESYGSTNPNNHVGDFVWQSNAESHWKYYATCQHTATQELHNYDENGRCECGVVQYTIIYNLNGGTVSDGSNPTKYTVNSNDILLVEPSREGYEFIGWSGTGLSGDDNKTVTIPKGSTDDREYTAHWKHVDHTGGSATCTEKAVCSTCSEPYGPEPSGHQYTVEDPEKEGALSREGDCLNKAEYHKSCHCGALSSGDADIFRTETNPNRHIGELGGWQKDAEGHWKVYSGCSHETTHIEHVFGADGVCECGAVQYTVSFDPNGGAVEPTSATTDVDGKLTELPTPTRSGSYRFDGWFTEKNGGAAVTVDTVFTANTTVYAHWTYTGITIPDYCVIKATAGEGGSITPSGRAAVLYGASKTFTITPNDGYAIADVKVDGKSVGAVKTYTFERIRGDHTIEAVFMKATGNPQTGVDVPFTDVSENDWFYEDVAYVYANDLMKGTSETTFSPDVTTTRGMIVTILYRLEGEPTVSDNCPFEDVKSGSYYEKAITWVAANEIVGGYGNGKFGPDDPITREQMAAILYRYTQYKGMDVSGVGEDTNILSYNDAQEISEYAFSAMQWACGESILNGSDGNLMPQGNATRAQVAAILHRFCENILK